MNTEQTSLQSNNVSNEEETPSLETSIFFDQYAIWLLLFFLLIAIWYRFVPLIVVSVFLLFLFVIITIWKKRSLLHIKPTLQLSKSRLFTNEEFQIHASLHNDKWLPLIWIEWCFPKKNGIRLGDNEEDIYTVRFLWLLWFQKVKWTLEGKALKRGVYNIGEITLRSGDGFRFTETEELHSLDGKLYVYPKLLPVYAPSFPASLQWGVKGKQGGFIEDPLLVTGIREYQAGDEFRRLNWRASSRTGKLQINVYQPVVTKELIIHIDVSGFVIDENAYDDIVKQKAYSIDKKEAFEWFLSVIASLALKYGEQGISIGFNSNGRDYSGKKMPNIPANTRLTLFLDQLAKINQSIGMSKMTALDNILQKGRLHIPLFIFCDHVTEGHYVWYQQYKHKFAEVYFYYKNETEHTKKLAGIAKPMSRFLSSSFSSTKES